MVLRQRLKKVASLKTVKVLDAFPKVYEGCRENSPIGGTLSIVSYILMAWLLISETSYYLQSKIVYKFIPDTELDEKIKIYVDLTVATPCQSISADVLDSTQQSVLSFGKLNQDNTWFELEPAQRLHFDHVKNVNAHLRKEYHQIHEYLWMSPSPAIVNKYVHRKTKPDREYDACRIHGGLVLNKVSGDFHVTGGKSVDIPGGHIHVGALMLDILENEYNFSHRINHFSFGDYSPGIIHPLEGDEKITSDAWTSFQYFIEVIPTEVKTFLHNHLTYQYSVKELVKPVNHQTGSHGVPGIYFKYDMSALRVIVTQERDSFVKFFIKLCATVGGIYVTSGMVNSLVQFLVKFFKTKFLKRVNGFTRNTV